VDRTRSSRAREAQAGRRRASDRRRAGGGTARSRRLPASGFALLGVERRGIPGSIGYCGLNPSDEAEFDAELAFELLRDVHGRGYATEAARAVVEWAASAGIRRLEATVWDWNLASRRVLQKLGFVETDREYPVTPHGRTLLTVLEL
jgi:ribosomal-protein-alanine N-acetyltransferase